MTVILCMVTAEQTQNIVLLGGFTCLTFAVGVISALGWIYATPLLLATILYTGYLLYHEFEANNHSTAKND